MFDPSERIRAERACPYLGLASDPSVASESVTTSHRCFRWSVPEPASREQQLEYCLSGEHTGCARYRMRDGYAPLVLHGQGAGWLDDERPPSRRGLAIAAVAAIVLLIVVGFGLSQWLSPAGRGTTDQAPAAPKSQAASEAPTATAPPAASPTAVATSTAQALAGGQAAGTPPANATSGSATVPSSATRTTAPASPTAARTASPVATAGTAQSTATRTPTPTLGTPRPTATPTRATVLVEGKRVYAVAQGDNLMQIALDFGITVDALKRANNLSDNVIRVGQLLVIP